MTDETNEVVEATDIIEVDKYPTPEEEARDFDAKREHDQLDVRDRKKDIEFKEKYFGLTKWITGFWAGFIMIAVATQIVLNAMGAGLSDPAFIALITTTTGTLLGFWYLIGRSLFPNGKT